MNNLKIVKLFKAECPHGINRSFKIYMEPDPSFEEVNVGMTFYIVSVNRHTGEVRFSMDFGCPAIAPDKNE